MKLIFAGTTKHAARILAHLISRNLHPVSAVITREDAAVGRKGTLTESPVAELAAKHQIPVVKSNRPNSDIAQVVRSYGADLGLVVAYGALLPKDLLDATKHGWLNVHYSLLPSLRGAAPVQWSLINGDSETGVTIFRLDQGMDTGDILAMVPTQIHPLENSGELLSRLTNIAISAIDEPLAQIESGIAVFSQQVGIPSFAKKISRKDARIDWSRPAVVIENMIRGMNPEPMAWTSIDGINFRILEARRFVTMEPILPTGRVSLVDSTVLVQCGDGSVLQLVTVQPAGKTAMSALDWMHGISRELTFDEGN